MAEEHAGGLPDHRKMHETLGLHLCPDAVVCVAPLSLITTLILITKGIVIIR